jgi:probable rRNA maturation factor
MSERAADEPPSTEAIRPAILVSNRQARPVDEPGLVALARSCLLGEGLGAVELSISFVEASEMEELHVRYLNEPGPTDVLSFPLGDVADGVTLLGDVVICPEVAGGQVGRVSRAQGPAHGPAHDLATELRLLLVHGILHLLGHDHQDEDERAEMWAKQEAYSGVRLP